MRKPALSVAVAVCIAAGCGTNTFNINFHDLNISLSPCCSSQAGNCICNSSTQPGDHGGNVPTVSGHCVNDFGEHTIVVTNVNPQVNSLNQTLPQPTTKPSVGVQAGALTLASDTSGLSIFRDLPTGSVQLKIGNNTTTVNIAQANDLLDVALSTEGNQLTVLTTLVYRKTDHSVMLSVGQDVSAATAVQNAVVLLSPGVFKGDVTITGANVLLFGACGHDNNGSELISAIDGNVTIMADNVRLRSLHVTGKVTVHGNNSSVAYCRINDSEVSGSGDVLLGNGIVSGKIAGTGSGAVLLDNVDTVR